MCYFGGASVIDRGWKAMEAAIRAGAIQVCWYWLMRLVLLILFMAVGGIYGGGAPQLDGRVIPPIISGNWWRRGAKAYSLTPVLWKSDGLPLTQLWLILSDYITLYRSLVGSLKRAHWFLIRTPLNTSRKELGKYNLQLLSISRYSPFYLWAFTSYSVRHRWCFIVRQELSISYWKKKVLKLVWNYKKNYAAIWSIVTAKMKDIGKGNWGRHTFCHPFCCEYFWVIFYFFHSLWLSGGVLAVLLPFYLLNKFE